MKHLHISMLAGLLSVVVGCTQGAGTSVAGNKTDAGTVTDAGTKPDGGTTSACNATTCPTGCCNGSVCQTGTKDTACGTGGVACATCLSGESCSADKVCAVTSGKGGLGEACTKDTDCDVPNANPNRCKLKTSFGNLNYKDGYCTRRCIRNTDCGDDGLCLIGLGALGESENICVKRCNAPADCRADGYACLNFGSQQAPARACWIADENYDFVDAGSPAPDGITGAACTADSSCQPPETGFCAPESQGFPAGSCSSVCSFASSDSFCGSNGVCTLYLAPSPVESEDPFVVGLCEQGCQTNGGGTPCRTGYACLGRGPADAGTGVCVPRCDNPGASACPSGTTCTNGVCQ